MPGLRSARLSDRASLSMTQKNFAGEQKIALGRWTSSFIFHRAPARVAFQAGEEPRSSGCANFAAGVADVADTVMGGADALVLPGNEVHDFGRQGSAQRFFVRAAANRRPRSDHADMLVTSCLQRRSGSGLDHSEHRDRKFPRKQRQCD